MHQCQHRNNGNRNHGFIYVIDRADGKHHCKDVITEAKDYGIDSFSFYLVDCVPVELAPVMEAALIAMFYSDKIHNKNLGSIAGYQKEASDYEHFFK